MSKAQMSLMPPPDKKRIVYLVFVVHGIGTLIGWNMFINAKSYFVDFKLSTPGPNDTVISSTYSKNFLAYVGFAAQIPNVVFNWLNIFVNLGGDLTKRIVYSILLEIIIFIVTVILAMVDSSNWPDIFFWVTMISIVLLNMANGVYQNTIYGMVATLPIKYTGGVVLGSNISGLFTTLMYIISKFIFSSQRTAVIYYFITAMLVLLTCFDSYFALPLNKFFRYHEMIKQKEQDKTVDIMVEKSNIPYWKIFKQAFPQLFNIYFTFIISLSVFPAIHSDIKPADESFIIPSSWFTDITCFLTFNLFAMLGSLATSWFKWPSPKYLIVPVLMRAVFPFLFIFCNYFPKNTERILPVLINNDWLYWAIAIVMSFTSGYFSSLGMMYAPQTVSPKHQLTAGMFAAAMLITGIFSGILLSFIYPSIVANISF